MHYAHSYVIMPPLAESNEYQLPDINPPKESIPQIELAIGMDNTTALAGGPISEDPISDATDHGSTATYAAGGIHRELAIHDIGDTIDCRLASSEEVVSNGNATSG